MTYWLLTLALLALATVESVYHHSREDWHAQHPPGER